VTIVFCDILIRCNSPPGAPHSGDPRVKYRERTLRFSVSRGTLIRRRVRNRTGVASVAGLFQTQHGLLQRGADRFQFGFVLI
jgi:hypothetical protein